MAAVAATSAPAQVAPVTETKAPAEAAKPFGTRWNSWVNGVFGRLVTQLDFSKSYSVRLADEKVDGKEDLKAHSTAWKVVKMAVLLVPMLAFSVLAAIGTGLSAIKNCVWKTEAKAEEKAKEVIADGVAAGNNKSEKV